MNKNPWQILTDRVDWKSNNRENYPITSRFFCITQKSIVIPLTTSTKVTIYKHSPRLLNVTGIRDFNQITSIETSIKEKFQCEIEQKKIDAIMLNYKSKTHQKINLNKLSHICSRLSTHKLDYNCELFNQCHDESKKPRVNNIIHPESVPIGIYV